MNNPNQHIPDNLIDHLRSYNDFKLQAAATALESAKREIGELRAEREEWRTRCEYLMVCIDVSNEAGAPVDESDPEDVAAIDEIRTALNKESNA